MIKVKFSHLYDKFPRDFQLSKLLEVLPVKLEDLSLPFRQYDTAYVNWESAYNKYYDLPQKGDYMILLLQAGSGHGQLWTTIRSQWSKNTGLSKRYADKMAYYKSHIGEVVECVINEV